MSSAPAWMSEEIQRNYKTVCNLVVGETKYNTHDMTASTKIIHNSIIYGALTFHTLYKTEDKIIIKYSP